MELSLAQRIFNSNKPFVLFHTHRATRETLENAISEGKSMDLDVCVDDSGHPYLGHSREYHEKSGEPYFNSMALWEAVDLIAQSDIVAMVDCKHYDAWPIIEEVVKKIGPERCLVCSYVSEFKFNYTRQENEPDFLTEWSPIEKLTSLKQKFPAVTITPCAKWLPNDLLVSTQRRGLLQNIRKKLVDSLADTVCLGVPDDTISDETLEYFLSNNIIPHVMIDHTDESRLSKLYVGETDDLASASDSEILGY